MSETAVEPRPPRRPLRWGRILILVGALVVVALLVVAVIPFALKPRANGTACGQYASAYNTYVRSIERAQKTRQTGGLNADRRALSTRFATAAGKASGSVESAIAHSRRELESYIAHPTTLKTALTFFGTVYPVQRACEADGSSIQVDQVP